MKKIGIGLIAAAAAGGAWAQSSATLYGIVDLGIQYSNDVQTSRGPAGPAGRAQIALTDAHSTGLSGSRWGIRTVEDLGGGLKALAVIENGFMANSGALAKGGAEFGRQVWVGLSAPAGTVTLGRQYDTMTESLQPFAATGQWAGYMGSHMGDLDNLANTNRINNSIKYVSPVIAGLKAGVLYSIGGVAGSFSRNQIWSVGLCYAGGPLSAAIGYLNARDPNVSFYGNTPNKGAATANNIGSFGSATAPEAIPVYAGYASAKTLQIAGAGVSYAFEPTTVGAVLTYTRFDSLGSSSGPNPLGYTGDVAFTSGELNVRTRLSPALLVGGAFDYTQRTLTGSGGAKYMQLDLGAIYSLSKRTDLYVLAAAQRASGSDSLKQSAVASISGFGPSATNKQVGLRVGMRHKF